MKAFIIAWLAFLILILTGAFWLGAHGNEFGSSTVSSSVTNSTSRITNSTSNHEEISITLIPCQIGDPSCSISTSKSSSTSEASRTISDYGQLGLVLAVVLGAVIGLAVYASKKIKK